MLRSGERHYNLWIQLYSVLFVTLNSAFENRQLNYAPINLTLINLTLFEDKTLFHILYSKFEESIYVVGSLI